jgi:hypothetical protein
MDAAQQARHKGDAGSFRILRIRATDAAPTRGSPASARAGYILDFGISTVSMTWTTPLA